MPADEQLERVFIWCVYDARGVYLLTWRLFVGRRLFDHRFGQLNRRQPTNGITVQVEVSVLVMIKLFNLLINELGPQFLKKGIIINKEDVRNIVDDGNNTLKSFTNSVELDGKKIHYEQLYTLDWSQVSENLLFKISESSETNDQ